MDHVVLLLRAPKFPEELYNSKIKLASNLGKIYDADSIYSEMTKKGVTPNITTFNILIVMHAGLNDHKKVYSYLRKMKTFGLPPDLITTRAVITMFGPDKDEE